jgi:hypothetical protein
VFFLYFVVAAFVCGSFARGFPLQTIPLLFHSALPVLFFSRIGEMVLADYAFSQA